MLGIARGQKGASPLAGLSGRSMLMVLGSLVAYTLVLGIVIHLGMSHLLASWNRDETEALHAFMVDRLGSLIGEGDLGDMPIEPVLVSRALEGLPFRPSWLVVTDHTGALLYFYREASTGGQSRNFLRRIQDIQEWHQVRNTSGTVVLKYSFLIPPFGEQESNRILLLASRLVLVWGCVIAGILSFVFAVVFSRNLKKQSAALVSSVERLAMGERSVALPLCKVTEFSHIAHAFASLQATLSREESLRRQWATDIAHDLRTPLTVLRGQLEGIRDGVFKVDEKRIEKVLSEAEKLEALINALSLLSRIETPGFVPEIRELDLGSLAHETLERFTLMAKTAGVGIRLEQVGASTISIRADPMLLERLLGNLVDNAIRYSTSGQDILISLSPGTIAVENRGVLPAESLTRLFDRLYRGDSGRSTPGSGLGLAIVKAIADAHGWRVWVETLPEAHIIRFILGFI